MVEPVAQSCAKALIMTDSTSFRREGWCWLVVNGQLSLNDKSLTNAFFSSQINHRNTLVTNVAGES